MVWLFVYSIIKAELTVLKLERPGALFRFIIAASFVLLKTVGNVSARLSCLGEFLIEK